MNIQLWLKIFLAGILYMGVTSPTLAALKFKSEWYFNPQEIMQTPVGVQESIIPYSDDRKSEVNAIEYSLADLEKRAEVLGTWWLRGAKDIAVAEAPVSEPIVDILPEESEEMEDKNRVTEVEPNPIPSLPVCDGIYFEPFPMASVYRVATDELFTEEQLAECVELEGGDSHDLLWLHEDTQPIGIRTYGQISTQHRLSHVWADTLQKDEFNVGVWVPEWTSSEEDVEVLVDGESISEDLFVTQITEEGIALFLGLGDGVRELRIVNHTRDEKHDFLIHAESQHDKIAILGPVISDDVQSSHPIQFTAQSDPTRFLQYYNEDVGVFFDIPSGFSFLTNKTMPHFFRYYNSQAQENRTFLWEPRTKYHSLGVGDTEGGPFNLHQVLTSIRSKREMGMDLENNPGMDLLVVATPLELAPPQISQVRVNEERGIQWHQLLPTDRLEEAGVATQVFVNPSEGEYWLGETGDGGQQGMKRKIWVMKGMDTIVGKMGGGYDATSTNN